MDETLLIVLVLILLPVLTVWAMAKVASLRGPAPPPRESKARVEELVTDALPLDERRDQPEHVRQQLNRRSGVGS